MPKMKNKTWYREFVWTGFVFLLFLMVHPIAGYGASIVTVTLGAGSIQAGGSLFIFEGNPFFFDSVHSLTRVSEPASPNGDGEAWQLVINNQADGDPQRFGAIFWALQGLNASSTTELVFLVKGAVGGESFEVGLKDTSNVEGKKNINDFVPGGAVGLDYAEVRIPLTQYVGVDFTSLDVFFIISIEPANTSITIFLDAMRFE